MKLGFINSVVGFFTKLLEIEYSVGKISAKNISMLLEKFSESNNIRIERKRNVNSGDLHLNSHVDFDRIGNYLQNVAKQREERLKRQGCQRVMISG